MMKISGRPLLSPCMLGAATFLMASIFVSAPAAAMSPINPASASTGKAVANGSTIEVRGGHGGGGGSGGRGGGWGGGWAGGRSVGGVSGNAIGAAPAAVTGAPRFAGHGFIHRRHFGGAFIGGVYYDDYPYDYPDYYDEPAVYPAPVFVAGGGCHRVLTVHGPRVVCHHRGARHYHHAHRRYHQRRHHRA
jgi:hypothetical protein